MKKNVLTGPFAMLKCVIGSKDAKHKQRKNMMRHFCSSQPIGNKCASVCRVIKSHEIGHRKSGTPLLGVTACRRGTPKGKRLKRGAYLVSTFIKPRHEWHDGTSEARQHAEGSIQAQFSRLALESVEDDTLHARRDEPDYARSEN